MEIRLKKEKTKFYKSNLFFLLILIFLLIVSKATYSVYQKEKISQEILVEKREEFDDLAKREEILQYQIERLKTERGVEEEIREKFSFVKGGEGLIILLDPKDSTTTEEVKEQNLLKRFFDFIF